MNLDQYFCFHTMNEKDVPDCHLAVPSKDMQSPPSLLRILLLFS